MSKAHDPHWRYVALHLEAPRPVGRRALQNALLGRARREGVPDEHAPQLTRLAWPHAIVRVHHHALTAARAWLPRIDFAVEGSDKVPLQVRTLRASGTIKALTDALGILQERGEGKDGGPGKQRGPPPKADARRDRPPAPPADPTRPAPPPGRSVAPPRR